MGHHSCNWEHRWIEFIYHSRLVRLQGINPPPITELQVITVENLVKLLKGNAIWAVTELHAMGTDSVSCEAQVPPAVADLLHKFQDVFKEPTSLPPYREFHHAIDLLPDAQPVNSRPYRYSPLQKTI